MCDKLVVGVTVDELVAYKGIKAMSPFEDRIETDYTDTLSLIIAMINTMIDVVTYALISFTSLSSITASCSAVNLESFSSKRRISVFICISPYFIILFTIFS